MADPSAHQLLRDWRLLLAFGFGSGMSPIVPGTVGTLFAVPPLLLMAMLPLPAYIAVCVLACVVGVYLCHYAADKLGVHDHKGIVWDEFVGLWVTFIAVPIYWQTLLAGFVLFRAFDMLKPWPICVADKKIPGGLGIMVDDLLAALAAAVVLQLLLMNNILGR